MRDYQRMRRAKLREGKWRSQPPAPTRPPAPKVRKAVPKPQPPQDLGDAIKALSQQQRDSILARLAPPRTRSVSS